jgi:hypothetical protein
MNMHPVFARILQAHGAPQPRPYWADQQRIQVDAKLTDAQRVAAIEGLLDKADGEAISLTFRMDADLRCILVKQLADLRDALRRTQEAGQ